MLCSGEVLFSGIRGIRGLSRVIVGVKRVLDASIRVRITEGHVDTSYVTYSMNPFDEIALEQAVRMKEGKFIDEVVAVTVGRKDSQGVLRTALAVGADSAIHVVSKEDVSPFSVAKVLHRIIVGGTCPDVRLVLLGKQAVDDDCGQVTPMLSGLLGWPQAMFASKLEVEKSADGNIKSLLVTSEVDDGTETVRVSVPAVLSVDLRLNEPRYATLPNIMKAKRKKLEEILVESLNIPSSADIWETVKISAPSPREGIKFVKTVDDVVSILREKQISPFDTLGKKQD